jgi:1-acyl-sn-glycerol-3-phosphate acyltransferase
MRLALLWFYVPCRGRIATSVPLSQLIEDGCVLAANHVSYLDWMVLHALFFYEHQKNLVFLAKRQLFDHPLWGPLMTESKSVCVSDDGSSILDRDGFRNLRTAKLIAIFPEGTRSQDGKPATGHAGAVKLAARLGKPVVPVALLGFFATWPRHRRAPRPARCAIRFYPPRIFPKSIAGSLELAACETRLIMDQIARAVEEFGR